MNRRGRVFEHRLRNLRPALEEAGVHKPARGYYALWFGLSLALYATCFALLLGEPSLGVRLLAILGAANAVMQIGLFAHEVGHGAVTASGRSREVLGQLSNSPLIGFGFSHWCTTTTRTPGGFGIRVAAVVHAIRRFGRRTAVDLVCIVAHAALWIGLGLAFGALADTVVNYCAITVLNGVYMGAILVVPHVGTGSRRREQELPCFDRQVVFSRNYDASALGTFLCGGLNLPDRAPPAAVCAVHSPPARTAGDPRLLRATWASLLADEALGRVARRGAAQPADRRDRTRERRAGAAGSGGVMTELVAGAAWTLRDFYGLVRPCPRTRAGGMAEVDLITSWLSDEESPLGLDR